MNWEQKIERLAAQARAETPPRVDVAQRVLQTLTAGAPAPLTMPERFWMWLAAASSAVAVPAAVAAFVLYSRSGTPLNEIVEAISWAMQ
jgi:anti-sigma-K factor RskA